MAVFVLGLVFLLALASYSDANYCICNSGLSDSVLQRNIDYACGAGADCSPILQTGPCFNPNTVRDHCNYAVNSYYQRRGNAVGSCDFQGTATVSPNPPQSVASGCVYPSSPSNAGGTTPSTSPPTGGTPTTPTTPTTPNTGGGTTSPGTFPGGSTTNPGTVPGAPLTPGFNLAPSGTGFGNTDSSSSARVNLLSRSSTFTLVSMISIVLMSSFICPMI